MIRMMIYVGIVMTIWMGIGIYAYTTTKPCLAAYCTGMTCVTHLECGGGCVCAKPTYKVQGICVSNEWEVVAL